MTIWNDLMHPVEYLSGTLPDDASLVDPSGTGPAMNVEPSQKGQTWGQWIGSWFTGAGTSIGGATGSTLAAVITPLLPILIILLVVLILTKVIAEKAVSSI